MFSKKKCEKCGKILPKGYTEPLCENCKGKKVAGIKNVGLAVAGGLATAGGIALAIVKSVARK